MTYVKKLKVIQRSKKSKMKSISNNGIYKITNHILGVCILLEYNINRILVLKLKKFKITYTYFCFMELKMQLKANSMKFNE